ncbi:hypothetical protein [Streptomyces sp. RerS4]|uniref:hypothetical protein n=1 Tax=Streptomyces sp. RerS4 TaxID=2942449 RepID=UPI00201BB585|nr:hypothetical protein [Streptomyces sp. RerS4]UQX01303.1 hypothetical protein M4D82_12800 [Streptomyces sp. RerS4]
MRSSLLALRSAGVAVALAACTVVTVPAALANEWDRGGVSAEPNPAKSGTEVKIRVRGCDADWAVARSSVFVNEVRLSSGHGQGHGHDSGHGGPDRGQGHGDRTLFGEARIASHAQPGWHEIRVKCGGRDEGLRGSIEVRRDHRPDHRPHPHHSPIWPVHAGGGGMSAEIAETSRLTAAAKKTHGEDGPGLPHTVIGAVLAAAATLAVAGRALTLRRRRNGG